MTETPAARAGQIELDSLAAASRFGALAHEGRVEIVRTLLRAHPDGLVVGEIQDRLGLPGSTLSHHLDVLRRESLVENRREGRHLRYFAGVDELGALTRFLYEECCRGGMRPELRDTA